ncbi:MAG: hypothetical protein QNL14_08760, partial [Deltaproteobacteria bacterium]|nr:hypothetical protein [Deltaproteobacteria bacterium]
LPGCGRGFPPLLTPFGHLIAAGSRSHTLLTQLSVPDNMSSDKSRKAPLRLLTTGEKNDKEKL